MVYFKSVLALQVLLAVLSFAVPPPETCEREWIKVGCFRDNTASLADRVYPNELVNHRDPTNPAFDGHTLDWNAWPESLRALACKCAEKTRTAGYEYFALQFYGECWSGPELDYSKLGPSEECIGNDYNPCNDDALTECIGGENINYVYHVIADEPAPPVPVPVPPVPPIEGGGGISFTVINGGWSEWGEWTKCSVTCGEARTTRQRACDNPAPALGGVECVGPVIEAKDCHLPACPPKCNPMIDIGIVLDSSTSIRQSNWIKMLTFMKHLAKKLTVGPENAHFGVIKFSEEASLEFQLGNDKYYNEQALEERMAKITHAYGITRPDRAFKMAKSKLMCEKCGMRKNAVKVLVVLTDGLPSRDSGPIREAVKPLKTNGVKIVAVGVGKDVNAERLVEIATGNVLMMNDVDTVKRIVQLTCN